MKSIVTYALMLILVLTACNIKPNDEPVEETLLQVEATEEPTAQSITPQPTFTPLSSSSEDTADTVQTSDSAQSTNDVQSSTTVQCTPRSDWFTYTVQRSDTLYNIAQRANSNVDTVAAGNCLDDPTNISVGQVLLVPNQIAASEYVTYWMPTETQASNSLVVGCESFVTPVQTSTLKTSDPATNIENSLNALFNAPASVYNYWDRLSLTVENVRIDSSGRATITIAGDVILIGTCGDAVMRSQIWLSVFSEPSVQTAYITANGRNLVQVFDMSGLSSADAVFRRADSGYANQ